MGRKGDLLELIDGAPIGVTSLIGSGPSLPPGGVREHVRSVPRIAASPQAEEPHGGIDHAEVGRCGEVVHAWYRYQGGRRQGLDQAVG